VYSYNGKSFTLYSIASVINIFVSEEIGQILKQRREEEFTVLYNKLKFPIFYLLNK